MRFVSIDAKKISEGNIFEHQLVQISLKISMAFEESEPKTQVNSQYVSPLSLGNNGIDLVKTIQKGIFI